ncbi:ribonucleotide reductase large subunit [Paraconexibacter sp. AEG42_29]|uniref:Ribonucleotide reductase large subunit n=1 Tax=Paraconexibacter sp. AEG42_29 TaxID=2997339 RepID=A0AAU7AS68_9ACTN
MADRVAFPNYTQIPSRVPLKAWQAIRVGSLLFAFAVAVLLVVDEATGLFIFWKLIIPALPMLFLVAPGLWRNICPLAASNQTPRVLGLTKALTAPAWLKEYGYVIAITGFFAFITLRKIVFDDSGPATALLLVGAMTAAFVGGMFLKGKSGWCSSLCPLLPVQRIYGQTPLALVANSHCQPCVGCTKSCYDFNPRVAYLADLNDPDPYWAGYRRFFVAAFPGLIVAFFTTEAPPATPVLELYARFLGFAAVSIAVFVLLQTFAKVSLHKLTTLFGAAAFNLFYWCGLPNTYEAIAERATPTAVEWGMHAAILALTLVWVLQTYRKEGAFAAQQQPAGAGARGGGAAITLDGTGEKSVVAQRTLGAGTPEVAFAGDDVSVAVSAGQTLLEVAEAQGKQIESGCRMGVCGADPVCVTGGMENLSAISDDERSTLERLGYADNTRMACCARVSGPVEVALTPERPKQKTASQIAGFQYDRSIERVVVVGNGIAGVTAADHVRRRHPVCTIDLVADEPHPLYNRMGIARLVYGRSAMQGLHLNPDAWYEDNAITTWLNTRATRIDRQAKTVTLGTGDVLSYDRLILAMGSSALVPRIDGFGLPGTTVLRTASDALDLRAFVQRHEATRAAVAGGGLLGLEAAYALSKLGVQAAVLERGDRLLRRQLDARSSQLLREYLEGLGLAVMVGAETAAVSGDERLRAITLKDGRTLNADILVVAAGIDPNVALARDAGLDVARGVLVDDRMRTSDRVVFAAGDVAEYGGGIPGLWPAAVEQATIAADNAVGAGTGRTKRYEGSIPVTVLKVVGIELTSIGEFEESPGDDVIALEESGSRYRKLVIRDGRIVGAILLGYSAEVSPVTTAVKRGFAVTPLLPRLRAGEWTSLADLSGEHPLVPVAVAHPT